MADTETAGDWAAPVRSLVDGPQSAAAERITRIGDTCDPHLLAGLDQAFAPAAVLRIAPKSDLVDPSKHAR